MAVRGQDIASVIKRQIEEFGHELTMVDTGVVVEVLDRLVQDEDERSQLGAEARRLILDRYAFSIIASRYRQLYDWLLGDRTRSPR